MDPKLKFMAVKLLKRHEGISSHVYKDHLGYETIGIGRNISKIGMGLRNCEIEFMITNDIDYFYTQLEGRYHWFKELNDARKLALISMAFQLGLNGFSKFNKMILALNVQNYEQAATEMLQSRWAKQTFNRAHELSIIMKTGEMR